MSNPTELPDRVEALRAALKKISETRFGWDGDCGVTSIADEALSADDEASAQPEGEAPQAVHQWRMRTRDNNASWHDAPKEWAYERVDGNYEARTLYTAPAATLSPLCGAQHAASGKEAAVQNQELAIARLEQIAECDSVPDMVEMAQQALVCARAVHSALAAQQAAAPGAPTAAWLIEWETATGGKRRAVELHNFAGDIRQAHGNAVVTELIARPISAPGTPEAPADDDALTVRVPTAAYLWLMGMGGDGFVQDRKGNYWYRGAFNERAGLDMVDIDAKYRAAIQRAAQLDGGQEGSES